MVCRDGFFHSLLPSRRCYCAGEEGIIDTVSAQENTKQAAGDFKTQLNQASKDISQETLDLRDKVKQAVDDHLGDDQSK